MKAFILVGIFLFSLSSFADEIMKRETLSHFIGHRAEKEFNSASFQYADKLANSLGEVLGESRYVYFDRVNVEENENNGIVGEKIKNCWHLENVGYECKTVYQERKWYNDNR